MHIKSNSISS